MSVRQLIESFDAWRRAGERIVLATVVATSGSTYSKAGAQMLISGSGQFRGLLSGGCLEGDLVEHARDVLAGSTPKLVRYDMRSRDEDELWGLGLGCDGAIEIFLQALDEGHEPFACMARRVAAHTPCAYALVLADVDGLHAGAIVVAGEDDADAFGVPARHADALSRACRERLREGGGARYAVGLGAGGADVLCAVVPAPVRLLVLGGGPDAVPLARIARETGWYVSVADHRPAYLERMAGAGADRALLVEPEALPEAVDLGDYDAAVIMSHHLRSDRAYLAALLASAVPYVGLLGPRARRERLLADTGAPDAAALRLYGPVGLDIGAQTPQSIALAIVAEIHAVLGGRAPRHLGAVR
jgi:xanthine dehydrogenase accessory factor